MNFNARDEYTAGLRELADILDAHPDVPLPFSGRAGEDFPLRIYLFGLSKEDVVTAVRAFPGPKTKEFSGDYARMGVTLHGLSIVLMPHRETVCTKRVVGTRTVVTPAAPARSATPAHIVKEDIVEWDCHPFLAEAEGT